MGEAKRNLGHQDAFYESLERALHNYLKAQLQLETSELSKDRIAQLLQERNVEAGVTAGFIQLLKSCEFARYAGASAVSMKKDYALAVQTISNIDKLM